MTKPSEIAAALRAAARAVEEIPDTTEATYLEKALCLAPASPEFTTAVVQFRSAGGTAAMLKIFARMAASARIRENDMHDLEELGIRDIRHLES